ncbi:MAG: glycoside hydrolase family 2 protein, partial [bacterium]
MKISLNGTWHLSGGPAIESTTGIVPGSVYGDLLAAGLIKDPFDQDNEYEVRDLMNHDYCYTRDFVIDDDPLCMHPFLVCDGIDTLAEIRINDILIGTTDNMHRRWRFDIAMALRTGVNHIEVLLHSCLAFIREKNAACSTDFFQAGDAVRGFIHLRKGSSMFGWDWGPQLPDAGIWRDIAIDLVDTAYLENVHIRQEHQADGAVAIRMVIGTVILGNADSLSLEVVIKDPNDAIIDVSSLAITGLDVFSQTLIHDAQRWYPVGYGEQPLYTVIVFLKDGGNVKDAKTLRIGLRDIHVKRENDAWGQSFTFVCNGIEIFVKGADYIPEDNLLGRTSTAKTRALLTAAREANHNMVRVWGGGIYPADAFYDSCDELGLLVWQDLMFACAVYDMDDAAWVATMKAEIADNLQRIRHHACIAIICGNNENEVAIADWGVPNQAISKRHYIKQYLETIRPIVEEDFPDILYWPSSPSSGGTTFDRPNADGSGDMHYWGVWHNNEPIAYYRKYFPRFMSEFGIQSFPSLKTVKSFARDADLNIFSYIMEQHQKNKTANDKILNYVGKMFRYPKDF